MNARAEFSLKRDYPGKQLFYVFMQKLFDSNHSVSWLECYVKRVGVVGGLCLIELFNSDFKAIKVQKHYKSSRNSIYGKH